MQDKIKENWKLENPFRKKLVFFEGLDKSGKSTLCRRVRFEGKHTIPFYERGFAGRYNFYHFNKEEDNFPVKDWSFLENILIEKKMYAIIWLRTSYANVIKRHIEAGEVCDFTVDQLREQDLNYAKHIHHLQDYYSIPVLELRTDKLSSDQCVEEILKWTGVL